MALDFYHLRENLQKSRRIVFGEESAAGKTWLEGVMHTFRHVGYDSAWDQMVVWRSSLRSPTKRKEANRVPCRFQGKQGKIVLDQLRTVDKVRLVKRLGRISPAIQGAVLATLVEVFAE